MRKPTPLFLFSLPFWALLASSVRSADLIISEFMAANNDTLKDENGDASDWIEIQNTGDSTAHLEGYHLTDDASFPTKWTFPAVDLAPGGFLVVFASGKDRRDPAGELHTNFRLSSSGEYLALIEPDGVTVVHEYAPEFPKQPADLSYGIGQKVTTTYLVEPGAQVRVLVPSDDSLGDSWTGGDEPFDDDGWRSGPGGVGYVTSVPGFLVKNYLATSEVSDLSVAEQVILDPDLQLDVFVENADFIDYHGTGTNKGHYRNNLVFPGASAGEDVDNFVIEATAIITFPEAGEWTFGVTSDDGFGLDISNGEDSFRIEHPAPRGAADTLGVFDVPQAGDYELRLIMYERGGNSTCELYAARGSYSSWSSAFRLVGDTASGGLPVRATVGSGGSGACLSGAIQTDIETEMADVNASVYVRIPFEIDDPSVFRSLSLKVKYDDGFVAYLNGVEIARRNAPSPARYNSRALQDRPASQSCAFENINVDFAKSFLKSGANILAFHAMNDAADSGDFLLYAELADVEIEQGVPSYFNSPTPGEPNSEGYLDLVSDTRFSVDRGFYTEPFSVEISTDTEGAHIRYTVDGTVPTPDYGTLYTGPVFIDKTTTLRALAYKEGYLPTNVDTQTYIFLDDVIEQDYDATLAAGFPTSWGGTSRKPST